MRLLDPQAHARVKGRILDAARSLFSEQGYHAASMAEVAARAGLGKAAVYHYFKSKRSLLQALHTDHWTDTQARIMRFPRFNSLKQALRETGREYLRHFEEPKAQQMTRIVFNMGQQDQALREKAVAMVRPEMEEQILTVFAPFFGPMTPPGQVHLFAMQFYGCLFYHVFVLRSLCQGGDLPVTQYEYLDKLVDVFAADPRQLGGRP